MGPRISTVITEILAAENGFGGTLDIFPEEVAVHYRHAVRQEDGPGRHLSVVFRATKAVFDRQEGNLPVTVATLFTKLPGTGRPFITALVECDGGRASPAAVDAFFRDYARVVTRPVVAIFLLYGIGLEAHQQNTTVVFGPDNRARRLLIRDFGDGRTYAPLLTERGYTVKPYVHPGILPTVFTDDIEPVRMFVLDAAFVSHLHEVALVLSNEYDFPTTRLWEILKEETEAAFEAVSGRVDSVLWFRERRAFLEEPWPTRSLLRMHMLKYANYRLQHNLTNPLSAVRRRSVSGLREREDGPWKATPGSSTC
jgi:D-ornithine---citrate ligase